MGFDRSRKVEKAREFDSDETEHTKHEMGKSGKLPGKSGKSRELHIAG